MKIVRYSIQFITRIHLRQAVTKVHANIKLLYFPFRDGNYSHPDYNSNDTTDDIIFSVLWQGRLVPETKVKTLKGILPDATTLKQCADKKVPFRWQKRLKGFIFLDDTFKSISNNKLKITVGSSFDEWLEKNSNAITKNRNVNIST